MSQTLYILSPILIAVLAHIIIGEKFTLQKFSGLLVALAGVILLLYQSASREAHLTFGTPIGNGIILIAIITYSFYGVFSKKLTSTYSPATTTFFSFLVTTLILSIFIPFEWQVRPFTLHSVNWIGWVSLILIVLSSCSMYYLIQFGIKRTNAFVGSLFLYIAPFFTAAAAIPIFGEKPTFSLFFSGLLIAFGVFYATSFDHVKKLFRIHK